MSSLLPPLFGTQLERLVFLPGQKALSEKAKHANLSSWGPKSGKSGITKKVQLTQMY